MQWLKVSGVVGVKALYNINSQLQYQLKMSLDDITNDFNKMQGNQKLCNPC